MCRGLLVVLRSTDKYNAIFRGIFVYFLPTWSIVRYCLIGKQQIFISNLLACFSLSFFYHNVEIDDLCKHTHIQIHTYTHTLIYTHTDTHNHTQSSSHSYQHNIPVTKRNLIICPIKNANF